MLARKKSKSRSRVKLISFITLGLLIFLGIIYGVFYSPLFKIREIIVSGAQFTNPTEIIEGGSGNILFWTSPVNIDELPHVSTHTIEKKYFEQNIFVELQERERTTIWCLEQTETCFWTDDRGFIFSRAPYPSGSLVVKVVRDYSQRDLRLGEFVLPENLQTNLSKVFNLILETNLSVSEVRIDDLKYEEMTVSVSYGPDIYFSLSVDPVFGKSVIESLRTTSEWDRMQYLDLRVENRAYYSL